MRPDQLTLVQRLRLPSEWDGDPEDAEAQIDVHVRVAAEAADAIERVVSQRDALLEACEAALSYLDRPMPGFEIDQWGAVRWKIRDALKKARGDG